MNKIQQLEQELAVAHKYHKKELEVLEDQRDRVKYSSDHIEELQQKLREAMQEELDALRGGK
jgi:hypothetical protein